MPTFAPEQFGAAGDGVRDDFPAFRAMWAAVNAARQGRVVMRPERVYRLNAVITERKASAQALRISGCDRLLVDFNGSKLDLRGDFDRNRAEIFGHPGLWLEDCRNIVIRNGELDGNVDHTTNSSRSSEAGSLASGIRLDSCSDVLLENLYVHHFQLDGIQIRDSGRKPSRRACRRVRAVNVRCRHNGRQGMSISALRGGTFERCEFSWTGFGIGAYPGHSPQAGVDIEPGRDTQSPAPDAMDVDTGEIDFIECRFENNRGAQFVNGGSSRSDAIRFERCLFQVGTGSVAGSDALIFGAPDSSMTACEIDLGADPSKRLYLGTNPNPAMRQARFSFTDNRVRGAGMLVDIYAQGGPRLTGLIRVERNRFESTRREFHKNPVIRNLDAAAHLRFRGNHVWIPGQCYGPDSRRRPVVWFGSRTNCTSNFYGTDLKGSPDAYFVVRYGAEVTAADERFAGTNPGRGDTIRPNGDARFDTRTPFAKSVAGIAAGETT